MSLAFEALGGTYVAAISIQAKLKYWNSQLRPQGYTSAVNAYGMIL